MSRRYTLVTGYHDWGVNPCGVKAADLFGAWLENTRRCFPDALDVFVIDTGTKNLPTGHDQVKWINMSFNPGHMLLLGQGIPAGYPPNLCGCTLSEMIGMLLAYYNNSDYIYKEQDCLAFGITAEKMYAALGTKQVGLGCAANSGCGLACEPCLHMVRRDYIQGFLARRLAHPRPDAGPNHLIAESKWIELVPEKDLAIWPWGLGRRRTGVFPPAETEWYIQKSTPEEMLALKEKGMITWPC